LEDPGGAPKTLHKIRTTGTFERLKKNLEKRVALKTVLGKGVRFPAKKGITKTKWDSSRPNGKQEARKYVT